MILGIGIDTIEIARVLRACERSSHFVERTFTTKEIAQFAEHKVRKASDFAAKEAVLKALGTGLREGSLQEIAVDNDVLGKPLVQLSGHFAMLAKQLGVKNIQISLSHSRELATAYVIMEDGK